VCALVVSSCCFKRYFRCFVHSVVGLFRFRGDLRQVFPIRTVWESSLWLLYFTNLQFLMQVPKHQSLQYAKRGSRLLNQKLHLFLCCIIISTTTQASYSFTVPAAINQALHVYLSTGGEAPSSKHQHPHFSPASNVPPTPNGPPGHTSSHQIRIQHLRPWWLARSGFVSSVALLRQCDQIPGAHLLHLIHLASL